MKSKQKALAGSLQGIAILLRSAWILALLRLVFMIRYLWLKVHRSPGPAFGRPTESIFSTG